MTDQDHEDLLSDTDEDQLEREELLRQEEGRNQHSGAQRRRRQDDPDERRTRPRHQNRDDDLITDSNIEENSGSHGDDTDAATAHTNNRTATSPLLFAETSNEVGIAATLGRLFPHGFPSEIIAEELKAQAEVGGDGAKMAVFRVETLQQQGLTGFAFLQQKDMTIHIMHSPAAFHARGASGPLKGKDIGFVGDRTDFSSPAPIVLQPEKPWKWITIKAVTTLAELETFYANPHNTGRFFTPPADATLERITIPRILMLPSNLLHFCAGHNRTPLDLLQEVGRIMTVLTPDPNTPGAFTMQDYDLVHNWCCGALHLDKNESSLVSYDIQAAVGNDIFNRWAKARLDATLGPIHPILTLHSQPAQAFPRQPTNHRPTATRQTTTPAPPPDPASPTAPIPRHTNTDLTNLAALAAEFGKGVMAALGQPGAGAAAALGANTDKREYDEFQKAMLQGFAHTPTAAGLPHIWALFCQTKSLDTHRLHIKEAMSLWARNNGVTINRGVYFTKPAIEDIVNLRFNPGGSAAYYATAEKGISILLCRSRPGEDRESARQHELAEELSSTNRSLSEAMSLTKSAPRPAPDTYTDLKASVGTFCALIWALFGDGCEYFRKLFQVYLCLDSDRACEDWANFTPLLCRQITWAIIDDGREYFSQTMLPERFQVPPGTHIRYPCSSLEELIRPIRTQSPILRANFPTQWLPRAGADGSTNTVARQMAATTTGSWSLGSVVTPLGTVTTSQSRSGQSTASVASSITNATTQPRERGGTTRSRDIRADNVHDMIKQNFAPHYQRFGQLQLTRLMMLAGVKWPEMPKLDKYISGSKNNLCYNYVLGRCTSRYCTHKAGHAPASDITTAFAHEICNLLLPGLRTITEEHMKMPWPAFQQLANDRVQQQLQQHES
jgi:hypothetical protein